jgi:hypothetical protein
LDFQKQLTDVFKFGMDGSSLKVAGRIYCGLASVQCISSHDGQIVLAISSKWSSEGNVTFYKIYLLPTFHCYLYIIMANGKTRQH